MAILSINSKKKKKSLGSREEGKDKEAIQSSIITDQEHHMGK